MFLIECWGSGRQEEVAPVLKELAILWQPADLDECAPATRFSVSDRLQEILERSFGNGHEIRDLLLIKIKGLDLMNAKTQHYPSIFQSFRVIISKSSDLKL